MNITAQQVKELRDKTGAPMMDCKSALTEANGDMEGAEVVLRKRGMAMSQKKAGRTALEGLVTSLVSEDQTVATLVEVNCESDFVARTDDFQGLLAAIAELVVKHDPAHIDALLAMPHKGETVKDAVGTAVGKLGENIVVRRFVRYVRSGNGVFGAYLHHGKIGVLVDVSCDQPAGDALRELVKDVAMHIAASDPRCIRREEVDPKLLEQEKEIQKERVRSEGKPEAILDKIVQGRLAKFYEEICLLEQPFIRDTNMSVGQWITAKGAEVGKVSIDRFTRFKVGEGVAAEK